MISIPFFSTVILFYNIPHQITISFTKKQQAIPERITCFT